MPNPGVFLDRDGVLIENVATYVRSWGDVHVFPWAVDACRLLADAQMPTFVVTNQAGVGRGIIDLAEAVDLNARILGAFEEHGAKFTGSYMCPHHPDEGCECRKPLPGMLTRAAAEHGIDLTSSFMVGDGLTDLQAGEAAGARAILVRTGRGRVQEALLTDVQRGIWPVVQDVAEAVRMILAAQRQAV